MSAIKDVSQGMTCAWTVCGSGQQTLFAVTYNTAAGTLMCELDARIIAIGRKYYRRDTEEPSQGLKRN